MKCMSTIRQYPEQFPEIWGGMEATINRVGNTFRDQLFLSGHYERPSDLEQFAELGFRKMRFPVLWEKHQPKEDHAINWDWATVSLDQLKEKGIDPIIGLVHHGSGPF